MFLVAISWVYILLTVIPLGVASAKLFGIAPAKFAEIAFLGVFSTTLLASGWAFFGRINIEFQIFHLVLALALSYRSKAEIASLFKHAYRRIAGFSVALKIVFWATLAIIILQSAAAPFVLDNESYYIQTVKWLNQYGFVNGLANLHVLLGQCSGWHIAQSVFSFSFLYPNFNDLSGFCLLLGNFYAFCRFDDVAKTGDRSGLVFGLFPVLNVFLLRFTGAPSPDIAVYVLTFIVADHFIRSFKTTDRSAFSLLFILALFAVYCKTSAISLMLLPLFWLISSPKKFIDPKLAALALCIFIIFIAKNCILSGYPLHPLPYFALGTDYDLPRSIADFYYIETKIYGYEFSQAQFNSASWMQLLRRWATLGQLHGFFNRLTIFLLVATPFFIGRSADKKALRLLYAAMVFQLVLLLFGSPQYRYYINFSLFFLLFCIARLALSRKILLSGIGLSAIGSFALLVFPFTLDRLTRNENTKQTSPFTLENLIFPYQNSKLGVSYESRTKGNLQYNSPVGSPFLWGTGDGKLPCVNKKQLDYLEKRYGFYPQLRTGKLQNGFYSRYK